MSLGPIAWFKEHHKDNCATCHSGGFLCNEGRRLWSEQVDGFITFLNGNLVGKDQINT